MAKRIPIARMYELYPDRVLDDMLMILAYGEAAVTQSYTMPHRVLDQSRFYKYLRHQFNSNRLAFPDRLPYASELGDYREKLKNHVLRHYSKTIFSNLESDPTLLLISSAQQEVVVENVAAMAEELKESVTKKQLDLLGLSPLEFERQIARAFQKRGFGVELTKRTRDGGYDIIALETGFIPRKILIECKHYTTRKIDVNIVRALLGIKMHEPCTSVMLVTTSQLTRDAKVLVDKHRWELSVMDYKTTKAFIDEMD